MKNLFATLLGILAISLSSSQGAALKFSPDLTGHYRGVFQITLGTTYVAGPGFNVEAAVPKNGRQIKIALDGYGFLNQNNVAIGLAFLGNLKITSHRKVVTDNALLAYNTQLPAVGRAIGKKTLSYTLFHQDSFNGSVLMNYTLKIHGKRILIQGSGVANGSPVAVSLVAKKHGR